MSEGTHIVRAYREHVVGELAVACGQAAEEIRNIESGLRYNKPIEIGSRGSPARHGNSSGEYRHIGRCLISGRRLPVASIADKLPSGLRAGFPSWTAFQSQFAVLLVSQTPFLGL